MNGQPLNIIVVEDDERVREQIIDSLNNHKIQTNIIYFENGLDLIASLEQTLTYIPDVIYLKLHQPLKTGLRCIETLKRETLLQRALLVSYSNTSSTDEVDKAFILGVNIFMDIPTRQKEIDKLTDEILTLALQYKDSNFSVANLLLKL